MQRLQQRRCAMLQMLSLHLRCLPLALQVSEELGPGPAQHSGCVALLCASTSMPFSSRTRWKRWA